MVTRRLLGSLVALALLLVLAGGCGSGGDSTSTAGSGTESTVTLPAMPVSAAQIERYGVDSPERVALEWWRTVQTNDPAAAREFYAVAPTLPNLAGQFNFVAGALDGSVKIVSVRQDGSKATVAVSWAKPGEPKRKATLRLQEEDGAWKLADTYFLDLIVEQLQESAAKESGDDAPAGG